MTGDGAGAGLLARGQCVCQSGCAAAGKPVRVDDGGRADDGHWRLASGQQRLRSHRPSRL
jgi:hypothetical protein